MINKKIGFIGAGNMAYSLVGGLTATGVSGANIWVSDPSADKMTQMADNFGTNTCQSNNELVQAVDIVILAVKPQQLAQVCTDISSDAQQVNPLFISIAAGVLSKDIEIWLNSSEPANNTLALVRCMPNTPSLVQSGATALFANPQVSEEQKTLAESILRAAGLTLWLDSETDMDAVTALSGSGPAYFFLVIDAMEKAGVKLGLDEKTAHLLAIQTAFGASKMALESDDSPETLRKKVTSPGGTTEKAIGILQAGELEALFAKALEGARDRSIELAKILGNE
jgi:pyrroline-5-carboxylate reductase